VWLERARLLESASSLQHVYASETRYDLMMKNIYISFYGNYAINLPFNNILKCEGRKDNNKIIFNTMKI